MNPWQRALAIGITLWASGMLLPLLPAHSSCKALYDERMRHARAPQITPEHAAAIRAWAETDGCEVCGNRGRISIFEVLYTHEGCVRIW